METENSLSATALTFILPLFSYVVPKRIKKTFFFSFLLEKLKKFTFSLFLFLPRFNLLKNVTQRLSVDGLNTFKYRTMKIEMNLFYTKMLIKLYRT
jgi:hypothetical protein